MRADTGCRLLAAVVLVVSAYEFVRVPEVAAVPSPCVTWPCVSLNGWTDTMGQWTASAPGSPWTFRGTAFGPYLGSSGNTKPAATTGNSYDLYLWTQSGITCPPPPGATQYESSPPGTAVPTLMHVGVPQYYCPL